MTDERALKFAALIAEPHGTLQEHVAADLSVRERVELGDARIRWRAATAILILFVGANGFTAYLIYHLAAIDQADLILHLIDGAGRVITPRVIMTLLGATTVQLGVIAVIMARSVFRTAIDPDDAFVQEE